jgi:DNA-binding CsgD family transcriptional regulator
MRSLSKPVWITSLIMVVVGIALLALSIFMGGKVNVALPLVFLVLAGGFFILEFYLRPMWSWASFLFIPAAMFASFWIIFLLNVITQDWGSWAYAWLLVVGAGGIGLLLARRNQPWGKEVTLVGWGLALVGITGFGVFGVIAGGLVIQIMAPALLVAAGLSLPFLKLDGFLPEALMKRLRPQKAVAPGALDQPAGQVEALVEPLSSRELEVLRLIDSGLSNQQIADQLSVAASTVKTHINNIYGKLGVQTRVQAVNRARELRLFDH